MSKTATVVNTRNLRTANIDAEGPSHHLITWGKGESKGNRKEDNTMNSKQKQGYVVDETYRGRADRRISIRNNNDTPNNDRSKTKADKSDRSSRDTRAERRNPGNAENKAVAEIKQKISIEEFYGQKGVDYRVVRKNCRIKVNGEGSGANSEAGVYLDCYQLPEGYSPEDLPDSQGVLSQHAEDPISPAVMIAAHHKKERAKILTLTPETDSDEIIRRIQMGRRFKKEAEPKTKPQPNANETFPDDSLNDSDLIMASQQVEEEHGMKSDVNKQNASKDVHKRDINGNSKHSSPFMTSTPVTNLAQKNTGPVKETPKTARAMSRSRNRSSGKTNNCEMFENSVMDNDAENGQSLIMEDGDGDSTPRKLLKFDESPIKKVVLENGDFQGNGNEGHARSGDFYDDDEDELFSQVEIPGEMRVPKPAVFESSSESLNSQQATQFLEEDSNGKMNTDESGEMDSYLDENALDAIAQLEAIHCTSGSSTGKSAQANPRDSRKERPVVKAAVEPETPRTRAYRLGLSRGQAVK